MRTQLPVERGSRKAVVTSLFDIVRLLRAGRWHEAHDEVQRHDSLLASWLHGILHLQEGDLEDAENWYDRAAQRFRARGSLEEELVRFELALAARDTGSAPH